MDLKLTPEQKKQKRDEAFVAPEALADWRKAKGYPESAPWDNEPQFTDEELDNAVSHMIDLWYQIMDNTKKYGIPFRLRFIDGPTKNEKVMVGFTKESVMVMSHAKNPQVIVEFGTQDTLFLGRLLPMMNWAFVESTLDSREKKPDAQEKP